MMKAFWMARLLGLLLAGLLAGCAGGGFGGMSACEAFGDEGAALIAAAKRSDDARLKRLLAEGVDVNSRGRDGITPLTWVMAQGDLKAAEQLIAHGADPNIRFDNGHSVMSLAAGGDRPDRLEFLLRHGGDPNLLGPRGDLLLSMAVLHRRDRHVELLLKYGADINGHGPISRTGAAEVAVGQARFDLAVRLLELGYDHDMERLARTVSFRVIRPDSPQQKWRSTLIAALEAKGYPVPSQR